MSAAPAESALLGPAQVRQLAEQCGVQPTKALGQNFVVDPNTVRRIVRAAELAPVDVVLEVGPGLGSLTLALLPAARRVVAVEVDPRLAAALPATVARQAPSLSDRFTVLSADALRLAPQQISGAPPTALVANLPYNVAVPVLLHTMATFPTITRALVMVQAEVAERLAAAPGSRTYGVPSVKARWFGDVRRAGSVSPTVFWPVPKVESGLVLLQRAAASPTGGTDWSAGRAQTFAVIDAAFAQRRKTLRAALAGWAGSADRAETLLRAADIDPRSRGEALDVADFARLAACRDATQGGSAP